LDEHVLVLSDWTTEPVQSHLSEFADLSAAGPSVNAILINGKAQLVSHKEGHMLLHFNVKKDHKYRFRVINTGLEMTVMKLSIEQHTLTVIAIDGSPVEPIEVDDISINPGMN
jgi:FtsP/CotA-like multicopper oxidase with cupredoxin domain